MATQDARILAADVGATKTVVALFDRDGSIATPVARKAYPSREHDGLESILGAFRGTHGGPIACAALAVAGPLHEGRAELTNLGWVVDREEISDRQSIPTVVMMNDLEGLAAAVPHLLPEDLHALAHGDSVAGGTLAVAAPGTGLGQAFLTWNGREYIAHACEGGHCSFAPTTTEQ
ncbi:MAG: glucokinase, partial [Candidatus Bipolaricaulota bacterium]